MILQRVVKFDSNFCFAEPKTENTRSSLILFSFLNLDYARFAVSSEGSDDFQIRKKIFAQQNKYSRRTQWAATRNECVQHFDKLTTSNGNSKKKLLICERYSVSSLKQVSHAKVFSIKCKCQDKCSSYYFTFRPPLEPIRLNKQ